jgi:hypothetical protein
LAQVARLVQGQTKLALKVVTVVLARTLLGGAAVRGQQTLPPATQEAAVAVAVGSCPLQVLVIPAGQAYWPLSEQRFQVLRCLSEQAVRQSLTNLLQHLARLTASSTEVVEALPAHFRALHQFMVVVVAVAVPQRVPMAEHLLSVGMVVRQARPA